MDVQNPTLYAALERAFQQVKITKRGEAARVTHEPDYKHGGRLKAKVDGGEYYAVNCPYCGDGRQRLWFNYLWGTRDQKTGRELLHFVVCYNQGCVGYQEQLQLKARLAARTPLQNLPPATANGTKPPDPPTLPENCIPINSSDADAGRRYLEARGFDVDELAVRWAALYCGSSREPAPAIRRRIVIPIYGLKTSLGSTTAELMLLGWQARRIDDAGGDDDLPKYLSARGLRKSELLYGLPQALDTDGPIVICEGPTDVWRLGSNAVALLGKTISDRQRAEVVRHFHGRPLVVLLDADAQSEAKEIAQQLRAAAGDPATVVLALPPNGKKDPGESKRGAIWRSITAALGTTAKPMKGVGQLRPPEGWGDLRVVRDGEAITKIGSTVAVAHIGGGAMILMPEDGSPRWVPEGSGQILASLKEVRRMRDVFALLSPLLLTLFTFPSSRSIMTLRLSSAKVHQIADAAAQVDTLRAKLDAEHAAKYPRGPFGETCEGWGKLRSPGPSDPVVTRRRNLVGPLNDREKREVIALYWIGRDSWLPIKYFAGLVHQADVEDLERYIVDKPRLGELMKAGLARLCAAKAA